MIKEIYLAGGCFWGMEAYFKTIDGIIDTEVGYANGKTENTNYRKVKETDHAETLYISYDDKIISFEKILEYFYYIIDPFSINKQGNDRGRQYRTGIFLTNSSDLEKAIKFISKKTRKREKQNRNRSRKIKKLCYS